VRNPLDPFLHRLCRDYTDDEDLSIRIFRYFKARCSSIHMKHVCNMIYQESTYFISYFESTHFILFHNILLHPRPLDTHLPLLVARCSCIHMKHVCIWVYVYAVAYHSTCQDAHTQRALARGRNMYNNYTMYGIYIVHVHYSVKYWTHARMVSIMLYNAVHDIVNYNIISKCL
jgi:hypothetical protein